MIDQKPKRKRKSAPKTPKFSDWKRTGQCKFDDYKPADDERKTQLSILHDRINGDNATAKVRVRKRADDTFDVIVWERYKLNQKGAKNDGK